jgi:hypothetical protein
MPTSAISNATTTRATRRDCLLIVSGLSCFRLDTFRVRLSPPVCQQDNCHLHQSLGLGW